MINDRLTRRRSAFRLSAFGLSALGLSAFALTTITFAGCANGDAALGPDGPAGSADILLGRVPGVSASVVASFGAGAPPIDFSQVTRLELVIDRVEAHRVGGGAWTAIDIEPVTIDLAGLTDGTVEPIASGGLPQGTYDNVRFFLQTATISFAGDVSVGGQTFVGDQLYDLDIPSVDNTGLKVPTAHFTVDGGPEAVVILFDPTGSMASIGVTGSGKVKMSPVLREADEATEAATETSL